MRGERALLERIAAAFPMVRLDVRAGRWDAAREAAAGIRFYGVPDGYELETFLGVLAAASARRPGLAPETAARLRSLGRPLHLEVLASPT